MKPNILDADKKTGQFKIEFKTHFLPNGEKKVKG